ncbi:MAG: hypothetical protein DRO76_01945 [Candidatus Altiarchaeales archaeon]|nr:MAG: hypothetical protein DRO76_01945 [Candidatus Altiarchaeales archaeon]
MEDKQTLKLAGLGLRATAVIIDTAILFGGEAAVFFTYFSAEALKAMGVDLSGGLFTFFMVPLWILYFTLLEGAFGQTIGKRITKIKVVKTNGERAGWIKILIRNLFRFIDVIGPSPYAVGMISIMVTKNRQRIGDIIAGTIVVKVDEL